VGVIKKYSVGLTKEEEKNKIVNDGEMPENCEIFVVTVDAKNKGEAICKALALNPRWGYYYFVGLKTVKNTPLIVLMHEMLEQGKFYRGEVRKCYMHY